jgi:hypothetical protein
LHLPALLRLHLAPLDTHLEAAELGILLPHTTGHTKIFQGMAGRHFKPALLVLDASHGLFALQGNHLVGNGANLLGELHQVLLDLDLPRKAKAPSNAGRATPIPHLESVLRLLVLPGCLLLPLL